MFLAYADRAAYLGALQRRTRSSRPYDQAMGQRTRRRASEPRSESVAHPVVRWPADVEIRRRQAGR
jgi:hypothetical protein